MRPLPLLLLATACSSSKPMSGAGDDPPTVSASPPSSAHAEVVDVAIEGEPGAYTFSVTLRSPDTGCDQYADWWEVVDMETDALLYRRILAHSHVNEQPFTRSGGPVAIQPDTNVFVRAHMSTTGYGPEAVQIAPAGALERVEVGRDYASDLASTPPLPEGCAF